ncbi:MAG TPA: hypothetical protein VF498_03065, partial [Anaerolineales bacterium]
MTAADGPNHLLNLPTSLGPDGQKITFKGRFTCPGCHAACDVILDVEEFACPDCARRFAILEQDGKKVWMARLLGPAWLAGSQEVRPFGRVTAASLAPGMPVTLGAARLRREKRRSGSLRLLRSSLLVVVIALMFVSRALLTPSLAQGSSPSADPGLQQPRSLAALAASPTPSPTARPTATASPTPTATSTPLPAELVSATAWSRTLAQAADTSHVTQTAVMKNYSATQTALPAIITALAQDRSATASRSPG